MGPEQAFRRTVDGAGLSPRELDVLALIADGLTNDAIAERTFLSVKSIEAVVRSMFLKLGLVDGVHDNRRVLATRMYLNSIPFSAGWWPSWASQFVGRKAEIAELRALIDRHRLVSVIGVGGIGKTRTVAEVAGSLGADGASIHFVDVTTASAEDGVLATVLDAFGVVYTSVSGGRQQLDRLLRAAPRLIVLDNAETRLDEVRHLVTDLLSVTAVRVVVTSREPLSIAGEQLFHLPPLNATDSRQLLSERIADITRDDVGGPIDTMLEHINGIPLAVELLAARFAELGYAEVNDRLGQLPNLLSRPGVDRHASLRAVLDASHESLDDDARRLFRMCSSLVGGFTRELIHDVFGESMGAAATVDRALDCLVRASLVSFQRERHRMLEPVRQYAQERLDTSDERSATDRQLIAWCERVARGAFNGFAAQPRSWRPRLLAESVNIETAILAAARADDVGAALRSCGQLSYYWMAERPGAGLALTSAVHRLTDSSAHDIDRAWGSLALGCLGQVNDHIDEARRHLEDAASAFERHGERQGLTIAAYWLALLNPTKERAARVVALASETANPYLVGWAHVDYAYDLLYTWRPAPGQSFDELAGEVERALDLVDPLVAAHGLDALRLGVIDARVKLLLLRPGVATATASHAVLSALQGESEQLARGIGSPWYILGAMCLAGRISFHLGRFDECATAIDELLGISVHQHSHLVNDQNVAIKGILLTACLLTKRSDSETGRAIVAAVAPNIARHPAAWIDYNLPVPTLADHARQHLTDSPLTIDHLYALGAQCHTLLRDLRPADP